jgi:hypothetical protein
MKDIMEWTRKEFEALPKREHFDTPIECDSFLIMPTRRKHGSGWRAMDFVAVNGGVPVCRCSGYSDVLHIDGISGYGIHHQMKTVKPAGWRMDCLPKSGLLRIFCNYKIQVGFAVSDFEILATDTKHYDANKQQNCDTPQGVSV